MLVGAAQCNLVCRGDGGAALDMCCCREVGYGIRTSCRLREDSDPVKFQKKCPGNPRIEMARPEEVKIVCGEHSLLYGPPSTLTTRQVTLPVSQIVNHPDFKIGVNGGSKEGPYSGSDLAIYKVHLNSVLKAKMERQRLWPACLPKPESSYTGTRGLFAGWDAPGMRNRTQKPSYTIQEYIDSHLPNQVQLEAVPCQDPAWMDSNTFYPAGTHCFRDPTFFSCPDYGNAGSGVLRKFTTLNVKDR